MDFLSKCLAIRFHIVEKYCNIWTLIMSNMLILKHFWTHCVKSNFPCSFEIEFIVLRKDTFQTQNLTWWHMTMQQLLHNQWVYLNAQQYADNNHQTAHFKTPPMYEKTYSHYKIWIFFPFVFICRLNTVPEHCYRCLNRAKTERNWRQSWVHLWLLTDKKITLNQEQVWEPLV